LRILNLIRKKEIGMLLTYSQYLYLTPKILINRLFSLGHYEISITISEILKIDQALIKESWGKIIVNSNQNDEYIFSLLNEKFSNEKNFSFAKIALESHRIGKKKLAVKILELENLNIYDICRFLIMVKKINFIIIKYYYYYYNIIIIFII
jgi:hypothetical protein